VVAGGHDQACGCLGAGVIEEGPLYDVTGTVECLMPSLSAPVLSDKMLNGGFGNYCHVVPGKFLILGYNMTAGSVLRWFRDNFARELVEKARAGGKPIYSIFDGLAESIPPGSEGLMLLPYFMGAATPNWDTSARGTLVGLTLAHGKAHVIRAIMEGITYELRNNLEALVGSGIRADEIRAVGGGARSSFWCQLKSDITHLPVVVPEAPEASSLGAAMLAGIGSGVYRDFSDAVKSTYQPTRTFEPEPKEAYERGFGLYREIYSGISGLYPLLSEIGA
jgi:xylulokinase